MKKQRKQLMILAAVLIVLAAAIPGIRYVTQKQEAREAKAAETEKESSILLDVSYEDVVRFSYDYEGVNYTFEKTEDTWQAADDPERKIDESLIKNMLSGVTPLYVQQAVENVTDLGQYGLEQPERTITFETASSSHIFYVGDYNTLTGDYYISQPSESTVYVVEQTVVTRFDKTYEDVTKAEEEEVSEDSEESGSEAEENSTESLSETEESSRESLSETEDGSGETLSETDGGSGESLSETDDGSGESGSEADDGTESAGN